jgi:hypothetical protein
VESDDFGFKTPVGGSGSATDVGSAALMLVVNRFELFPLSLVSAKLSLRSSRFINGESILVDGGTLLVHPSKY